MINLFVWGNLFVDAVNKAFFLECYASQSFFRVKITGCFTFSFSIIIIFLGFSLNHILKLSFLFGISTFVYLLILSERA